MNPPPVNGQYDLGQTVEICGSFSFSQAGAIWVHGIVPNIPQGWDLGSLQLQPPNSCSGTGTWGWYNSVTGIAASAGTHGPGFFYDTGNDGNPGNNFGDNCFGGTFNFCITLTTTDDCLGGALDGSNLNITFQILGDNASGAWSNTSCPTNGSPLPPPAGFNSTLSCCSGEEITATFCDSDGNQILYDLFTDSPGGGTWQNPGGGAFNGTFIPGTSADGMYTYTFDDGDCAAESTVEVTTIPAPDAGNGENITVCEGADPFNLFDQIVGGDAGGEWTDPANNPTSITFTPGTSQPGVYTYTVDGGGECPSSQTVVIVTVNPNPSAGDDGSVTVCESDPDIGLINFLLNNPEPGGTWTDPSGNNHSGTLSPASDEAGNYTYTVGDPPCSSSAVVVVNIIDLPYAGEDALLEVCEDDDPIDLFTLLPGADAGGFWANPNNAGFGGTFEPGSDIDGVYTYQIGGAACNDVATVTVTTLDPPTGIISAESTYCEGSAVDLTFDLDGTGPFTLTFSVNGTETTLTDIISGHTESINPLNDVTVELVTIGDNSAAGCTGTGNSIDIEMIPTPSATIDGGGGLCAGEDGTLTFTLTGVGPFNVVYTDGTDEYTLNSINDGHTVDVSPEVNTTYTLISVEGSSASSCEGLISGSATFNVNEPPSGTISGDANICLGESTELTFSFTGDGPFDVVYTNGADNFTLNGINDGHTVSVSPQFLSFYQLVSVISQGNPDCPGVVDGFVEISVSVPPTYNNLSIECNDINEAYVVSFNIAGGNPNSYEVDGDNGTLTNNTFTSDEIPSGSDFMFLLDDGNGCGPVEISGNHVCNCESFAGTMQLVPLEACEGEEVTASHNNNHILDGNDVLLFILHDEAGESVGEIFDENDTPTFSIAPGMQAGTTYYISAVVGNEVGSSLDFDDPCLSVSIGTPVVFLAAPTATISGSGAICPGEAATLTIELTGTAPWTVEYAIDGVAADSFTTSDSEFELEVNEGGTFSLISVADNICSGTTLGEVEVIAYDAPTAAISGDGNICAGSGDGPEITLTGTGPWVVTYTIDGGNTEEIQINNSPFTLEATQSGSYTITAVEDANCTGEGIGSADITLVDPPIAGVSGGGSICAGDDSEIFFSGTGTGIITVNYALNGSNAGSIDLINGEGTLPVSEAGEYTVTEVVDEVCSGESDGSSATLVVNPIPTADIQLNPSSLCEGDSALLSIAMTGNGPFELVYSDGDDLIFLEQTNNVQQYIFPENGQEFMLISVADNSDPQCSQNLSQSVTATVLTAPEPPVLNDIFRCNQDSFPQIGVEPIPGLSYNWVPQAGLSNPNIANPVLNLQNNSTGEQTYTYNLVVGNGICSAQSSMELTIDPGPNVDFTYSPNPVTTEATTVNFINQTDGMNEYEWKFDEFGSSSQTNTIFTFPEGVEGSYPVTLAATHPETGCTNEITKVIDVIGSLLVYVPNAFTPNEDGINDLFGPVVRNYREDSFDFRVFNRQGELVFSTDSPDIKWNGGEPENTHYAVDGVYVWVLNVSDIFSTDVKEFKGKVTLLR